MIIGRVVISVGEKIYDAEIDKDEFFFPDLIASEDPAKELLKLADIGSRCLIKHKPKKRYESQEAECLAGNCNCPMH